MVVIVQAPGSVVSEAGPVQRGWHWLGECAAALVVLLGLAVIFGWHTGNHTLVQVVPAYVPMQYNTALCFALCGTGALLLHRRKDRLAAFPGGLAVLVGLLTLAEYAGGVNLGIDELLMRHDVTVETSQPGRMAPNTAICFALAGTALVLLSRERFQDRLLVVPVTLISLALGLSVVAFCGYLVHIETAYGWGTWTRMAVHTAAGFVTLTLGLLAWAWARATAGQNVLPRWLPIPSGLGALTITLCFWEALRSETARLAAGAAGTGQLQNIATVVLLVGAGFALTLMLAASLAHTVSRRAHDLDVANRALRASKKEEHQRLVDNLIGTFVYRHGPDGMITYVSSSITQVLGYAPSDFLTHCSTYLTDHPINQAVAGYMARALQGVQPPRYEAQLYHKDGSVRWLEFSKVPIRDDRGQVVAVEGIAHDITARVEMEEQLRKAEHIVSSSKDMLALLNMDYVYLKANATYLEAFGKTRDEVVGHTVAEVFGEEFLERVLRPNAERCMAGEEVRFQAWLDFPAWGRRYMDVSYAVCDRPDGAPTEWTVSARDITKQRQAEDERRALQEQVQHAQKLESLGVLAGGIAHDFNNLLTGILGAAELADLDLPPESTVHRQISDIRTAALHAAELTKQMLAYSGKGRFVVEPLNLNRRVEEITHLLETTLPKGVLFQRDLAAELPAVHGDAAQMQQVIMNLIINAGEAIGARGGVVTVSTGVVAADAAYLAGAYAAEDLPPGDYVYLRVSDTGAGMDAETRKRIFDPFFTTKFQGRGLGLAAVLGIVRGHKGALKVSSEPGRGTTFTVLLPALAAPAVERVAAGTPGDNWRGSGTVLVVDDEERVRQYAEQALSHLGFSVLLASDGRDGVEMFRAHADEIVFVLLDMTMPRLNGTEAFTEIRRIRPDAAVILSSGYNEQEATDRLVGKGLAGFLQKPYNVRTLSAVVRDLVSA